MCVVIPVVAALVTIGGLGFLSAYNEAQQIYDTELSHVASLTVTLLSAEDQEEATHARRDDEADERFNPDIVELGTDFDKIDGKQQEKIGFRIWKKNRLLFYSPSSADFGAERKKAGFFTEEIGGKEWRVYVLIDAKSGYTLEVAQKLHIRQLLITKILTTIFSPLALAPIVILLITWIGLSKGLAPLVAVSDAVKNRSALDLTPLPTDWSLDEITPLINSLNGLFTNLDYALKKERRFTDFAAHELRTPIAVLKTQAQTALKSTDPNERRMILKAQVAAANRATSMVDQLLALARLEHVDIPAVPLLLNEVATNVVQEKQTLAAEKRISLRQNLSTNIFVKGNKELIEILLSNLIENAIKYTPEQGEVVVSVCSQNNAPTLIVADTGQGVPETKLPYLTEPFYRVAGHQQPGAGLGLAIVSRTATLMGATLALRNKDTSHGFEAIVQFPADAS
ncbi:MAG: sensor histidine kinase N-terminal domain-containing protein [Alphaproteobacteria bacterium]|nr:sensor histidine kinase N-terminal domain-containing protein [Alphaproteobacteria bacterium]